jgi:hypothetical protein
MRRIRSTTAASVLGQRRARTWTSQERAELASVAAHTRWTTKTNQLLFKALQIARLVAKETVHA